MVVVHLSFSDSRPFSLAPSAGKVCVHLSCSDSRSFSLVHSAGKGAKTEADTAGAAKKPKYDHAAAKAAKKAKQAAAQQSGGKKKGGKANSNAAPAVALDFTSLDIRVGKIVKARAQP